MTRFSPPIVYQCPTCAGYFTRSTLGFMHYHDDVPDWSDGRSGQWWARAGGPIGRCPACRIVVWIDDAKEVMPAPRKPLPIGAVARVWHRMTGDRSGRLNDEREWNEVRREIKEAEQIDSLQGAQDFIEALTALSPHIRDREVYLRRQLWWALNDHRRLGADGMPMESKPAVTPAEAHANILRLLELFEHDLKHQVERGELLRQLGRFDEAVAVLKAVRPDGYSEVKAVKIERLAAAGIAGLRTI